MITALPNEVIENIATLAKRQVALMEHVANLENSLSLAKEDLRRVQEESLPDAMMAVGMESFKLADGSAVKIDKFYAAKIPEEKSTEAFAWLRKNDLDSVIKREIKASFGKGEDERATLAFQALLGCGATPTDKQTVHPMTLKSLVRERLENGEELPHELFGVFVGNRAKVTPAK